MASVVVNGDTSGAVTLTAPAVAGTVTVTLPSTSGTMAVGGGTITTLTTTSDITVQGVTVGRGGAGGAANTAYGASAIPIAPNSGVTAIGSNAGKLFNTASDTGQSTFVGYFAGASCVSGTDNTFIGGSAGTNTTGSKNTAVGSQALQLNTTASNNTAVGYQAGYSNTTASNNTAVGYQSLYSHTAGGNTNNTAVGRISLYSNTSGTQNTAVGNGALYTNSTANNNSAFGESALYYNTTGASNTAMGQGALQSNTTASNNTAVGYQAGYSNQVGAANTFIGYQAGYYTTGSPNGRNVFVGEAAGFNNTSGRWNTYIGHYAGQAMTTGASNTIIGRYDGNQGGLDIRTASNYIVLSDGDGNPAAHRQWGAADWSILGNDATATSGIQFRNNANTKYWAISTNTTNWYLFDADSSNYVYLAQNFTAWTFASDQRLKKDIEDIDYGLSAVMAMRPRRYTYKTSGKNDIGFIAQELRDVIPEAVSGQEAEYLETDTNEDKAKKSLGVSRDTLIPVLVKAIQELKAEVDSLKAQINGASA